MIRTLSLAWVAIFLAIVPLAAWGQNESASKDEPQKPSELREQTIYIPYAKLKGIFEKEGRGVFIPYEKFQELWKAAQQATQKPDEAAPPFGAILTEIESEATISGDVMNVSAKATVELLKEGWHEIPLRLNDAAFRSAKLGENPARILYQQDRGYFLVVEKKGKEAERLTLTLEYAKAFQKSPGSNAVSFAAPQAPVNRWKIRIPDAGAKINVQPMLAATKPTGDQPGEKFDPAKESLVLAFVGAAAEVKIDWTAKAEGASGLDALVNVRVQQAVTIDEGVVRTRGQLLYEISRAELKQLQFEVPADQKVVNVVDANVRQWDVKADAKGLQTVVVQLFQPARGMQALTIEMERFAKEEEKTDKPRDIAVPNIKIVAGEGKEAIRQQGIVVVRIGEALRGEVTNRLGLMQFDAGELPDSLKGQPWMFSYRYASLPFELTLNVEKVKPQLDITQLVEVYLEPEQFTLDWLGVYQIERAGVYQLEVQLPEGLEVRRVEGRAAGDAQPVSVDSHQVTGEKKDRLIVNLNRKAIGKVSLWVELQKRLNDANLLSPTGKSASLPFSPPQALGEGIVRARGGMIIHAPESLRLKPEGLTNLRDLSLAEAYFGLPSTRDGRFPTTRESHSFAFTQEAAKIELQAERRKPQITARQFMLVRIESGVVKYDATFHYDILYSGVKSLRLDVPTKISKELRKQTPELSAEPFAKQPDDVAANYTAWEITGTRELLGAVPIRFTWEEKLDLKVGSQLTLAPPRLVPQQVDRAWGQIAIAKAEDIEVAPAEKSDGLRPIDPQQDLAPGSVAEKASRAFEFHEEKWTLELLATRYELQEVKRTSIDRAVARMVVLRSHDGKPEVSVQALYRLRTARQRLAFKLPSGVDRAKAFDSQPLRINGQAVTLEQDQNNLYVPLAGRNTDEPFILEIRYVTTGGPSNLVLPEFPEEPAVQQVYLAVYLPQELKLLGTRGPWTHEGQRGLLVEPTHCPISQDHQLLPWVREGVVGGEKAGDGFPVDGTFHLFSALRPEPDGAGALKLTTMHDKTLYVLTLLVLLAVGIALLWTHLGAKIIGLAAVLATLILLGIFAPTFTTAIWQPYLGWCVGLIGLLWLGQGGYWCWEHCPRWWVKRENPNVVPFAAVRNNDSSSASAGATPAAGSNEPSPESAGPTPPPSSGDETNNPSGNS